MVDLDFFSSPIGLGHATRDAAITSYFDNISSKFVTGSGAAKILQNLGFIVDDVYVPPRFNVNGGALQHSAKWLLQYYQYYKNCKTISENIVSKDKPKLVVSDEDFASLSVAQSKKIPTILITDILETHFTKGITSFIERKMNQSMQKMIKKSDVVILPEYGENQDNIIRVGPIVRKTNHSRDKLRKKFSFERKTILVSIGGTDAGLFLIEKTLENIPKLGMDVDVVVVSGPSLNKDFGKNIRNLGFVDNLHELILASDMLVSLAGKSTIDEAKAYGTPGIFIPIKNHFEQEGNARDEGYSFEDIHRMDELIKEKIDEPRKQIDTSGANESFKIIKKLLDDL